ncbi:MAG TPA: NADH-quinone oxidoreductase subunit NuoK [Candidatus Syntrophoarchaeum butanivorans]|nr:MAG: NADH-quinone oxidoreductase subunit NuoK [Candidatus Syntrophoarchaeum sp. WYZ-LMO15]HDM36052.1 NADH-quinone oxidoreductase subunit NuoK [Candidatus Syntrophoarchaeum butanivorans]HEC56410.1 NADH-quinone oxidoreductase subunit NuoK [Candidatus Syntrophoarchaeum butanivorans]
MVPLEWFLILSAILFSIGAYGIMIERNGLKVLMCLEILLNSANINLAAFSRENLMGQEFALFSIAIAAAEVAVGLALLIMLFRYMDTIDLEKFDLLRW